MLENLLHDWKSAFEGQKGYLAYTIQEADDQLFEHLSRMEGLLYIRVQDINKSLNNYLSMFRASDPEREHESLNGILECAMQFRHVHVELKAVWSKLISLSIPRLHYNFQAIQG